MTLKAVHNLSDLCHYPVIDKENILDDTYHSFKKNSYLFGKEKKEYFLCLHLFVN